MFKYKGPRDSQPTTRNMFREHPRQLTGVWPVPVDPHEGPTKKQRSKEEDRKDTVPCLCECKRNSTGVHETPGPCPTPVSGGQGTHTDWCTLQRRGGQLSVSDREVEVSRPDRNPERNYQTLKPDIRNPPRLEDPKERTTVLYRLTCTDSTESRLRTSSSWVHWVDCRS